MHELFPLAIGVVIGLAVQRVSSPKLRAAVLAVLGLLFGALASFISGELELSWGFVSLDALLVWSGALAAIVVAALWRRRALLR